MSFNSLVGSKLNSPCCLSVAEPVDFIERETAVVREHSIQSEHGAVSAFVRRPGARVKEHAKNAVDFSGGICLAQVPPNFAVTETARKVEIGPPPSGTTRLAKGGGRADNQRDRR